jgi:hypothetical protein
MEPIIRVEVIGGVPIAYRGFEELGRVRIIGSRRSRNTDTERHGFNGR